MSSIPKVSIIMATYNRAHFIVETLQSIQNQTFEDWECLIIDDGGNDNTKEKIIPILQNDHRFRFVKRSDNYKKGLPGCRNYGLDLAKGDCVIFFDDDDIVHPQNLEISFFELTKGDVSFCRYIREVFRGDFNYNFDYSKDYDSFYIDKNDVEKILKNELPINSCAVLWKKECFKNNRFEEHLMYAEEWELYSRIISLGFVGISIEKCLFFGRKHLKSNTGEFYSNNPIRRESKKNAILLIIQNLERQKLLSDSLLRYFIQTSLSFKEYQLFDKIINNLEISKTSKIKWRLFYFVLPFRLILYRVYKKKSRN
ncbi:glycosyltransferase family 2 protein [Flavobacterium sp. NG2]|uniref:glycosyltransferase family 2 protein n=1 Tax=Flavobacterium sp. NG2 TaxID=3097547 RepID=UPI002A806CCA|nr:glycosyltransferase family 2 protein [Flavobacterium sp. NG2]WPR71608.1 glycosyltransferase family 2 protein [Flavobacterium sp. NG2]